MEFWNENNFEMGNWLARAEQQTKTSSGALDRLFADFEQCYGATIRWIHMIAHDGDMAVFVVSDGTRIDLWRSHDAKTCAESWHLWYPDYDRDNPDMFDPATKPTSALTVVLQTKELEMGAAWQRSLCRQRHIACMTDALYSALAQALKIHYCGAAINAVALNKKTECRVSSFDVDGMKDENWRYMDGRWILAD